VVSLETNELARLIVDAISDKKGEDIVMLDLQEVSPIADYFVIATANSERQLNAISDGIREKVKEATNMIPRRQEGQGPSGWILMDYEDVVIHLFSPQLRGYYELEALWADANVVVRMQ
jgi:ribosome-associated protein